MWATHKKRVWGILRGIRGGKPVNNPPCPLKRESKVGFGYQKACFCKINLDKRISLPNLKVLFFWVWFG
ncbi:hypothetical protein BBW65_02105 [Helicobacter enhydrae]|uniref:Uncharacterized protein n=1 Tax=Helicobacter enhydrae TaxID=222136 RepID=A0A1B1U4K6_9HELI|nr:hypothetical protein BBW65_02105 [Helicobacter enhydrae]